MTYLLDRAARWATMTIAGAAAIWLTRHASARSVRGWRSGGGISRRAGILQVRTFGSGAPVVLLLHGMAAAGNSFGAAFDRLGDSARVVVPDLLGFGGSMLPPGEVSGEDHLDALDAMLAALGLTQAPLIVVGHSMGGPLALRFAARHIDRVRIVITLCAALYRDDAEADARIALWVAIAIRPDLPVTVARSGVKHTWDSYRGALDGLLRAPDWEPALDRLAAADIPVILVEGGVDPVPVPGRAAALAETAGSVRHLVLENATHLLPLSEGDWCAALLVKQAFAAKTCPTRREGHP